MEQEYGLHSKEKNQGETWQLNPIDVSQGNLKKQVANVIKSLSEMYCFQTLGEYRALLSLYNIGVEEIKGENKGKAYRGLVYSALDGEGKRVGTPLKSSLFGKDHGLGRLEKRFDKSKETIKATGIAKQTRTNVSASFANTRTENEFRADLRERGIDLVLRRNDEGRIYGATFIDHNQRVVFNGSRLGKEFSANVLNERFADNSPHEYIQAPVPKRSDNQQTTSNQQPQSTHSETNDPVGSLFSVFTPEVAGTDNKQPTLKRKKKKKRRYGRQQ